MRENAVHAGIDPAERGHLLGDIPALILVAIVLGFLAPREVVPVHDECNIAIQMQRMVENCCCRILGCLLSLPFAVKPLSYEEHLLYFCASPSTEFS